jgi:peptide-methionine (S)-S-oxide reductase
MASAIFAAGCFWGVEAHFAQLKGVLATEVGYTGGTTPHPTYDEVCAHGTGHAEAVRVEYDPGEITYDELLLAFFGMHDPTQIDRQGADVGSQYRSAVFFLSPEQEEAALVMVQRLKDGGHFPRPIVTEITAAGEWWPAEEYHQKYFEKHGRLGCAM